MTQISMDECKHRISEGLSDILAAGFKFRKGDFEFIRRRGPCIDIFRINIHKMTQWHKITPSVFIGCPKINKLFNRILQRSVAVNGSTFGFSVRNRSGHARGSYGVEKDSDFASVCQAVLADFQEIALPWFDRITDLASVDMAMNEANESGQYKPESVSDACLGLIAARLNENPAFDDIAEAYYQFCAKAQNPQLANPILVTRDYLKNNAV